MGFNSAFKGLIPVEAFPLHVDALRWSLLLSM